MQQQATTQLVEPTKPGTPSNSPRTTLLDKKQKYYEKYIFPICCDNPSKYEKLEKIGHGTYGEVFKAQKINSSNGKMFALKKVLMDDPKDYLPKTALREIGILQLLKHENIVNFIELYHKNNTFYLVFDFCEHDLAGVLRNPSVQFTLGEIKGVMQQLLNGLHFMHHNSIMHRDLKPANILITKNGVLKLADFGLSRPFKVPKNGTKNCYTNRVVTLWYRPPELLLGECNYGPAVDMWSVGCIMAEMWTRSAIFKAYTEQKLLKFISQLCGSITPDVWPGVERLELYNSIDLPKDKQRRVIEYLMPYVQDEIACDLLDKLLVLDPSKRSDANTALDHDFFWTDPLPSDLKEMLSHYSQGMFEYLARQGHTCQKRKYCEE